MPASPPVIGVILTVESLLREEPFVGRDVKAALFGRRDRVHRDDGRLGLPAAAAVAPGEQPASAATAAIAAAIVAPNRQTY